MKNKRLRNKKRTRERSFCVISILDVAKRRNSEGHFSSLRHDFYSVCTWSKLHLPLHHLYFAS